MSEVLKGQPIPTRDVLSDKLAELAVGDARDFPLSDNARARRNAIYMAAKRLEIVVTVRKLPEYYRVWRTA